MTYFDPSTSDAQWKERIYKETSALLAANRSNLSFSPQKLIISSSRPMSRSAVQAAGSTISGSVSTNSMNTKSSLSSDRSALKKELTVERNRREALEKEVANLRNMVDRVISSNNNTPRVQHAPDCPAVTLRR